MSDPTLHDLHAAAAREDWDFVDAHISTLAESPDAPPLASSWLEDEDGNIRDLGASVFEVMPGDLSEETIETLRYVMLRAPSMMTPNPVETFEGFRAACALFAHDHRDHDVVAVLSAASEHDDEDVATVAKRYLTQLEAQN